ncbi:MAG: diacylglycerol kinase family protein [Acidobacteriota bacterium]
MRPSILIYNPVSGSALSPRKFEDLLAVLRDAGYDPTPTPTQGPGDAQRIAREKSRAGGIEVAFALGGDGTLREVAAGLIGTDVALGALPAGTANVLAFELGLARRPMPSARSMAGATVRKLDVGYAGDVPFLMMVSGGLDALVMSSQNSAMKRRFGPAAVFVSGLKRFAGWQSPMIEIEVDGQREQATFFSVCNIPFYGGPFKVAPDADAGDGELDLVTFTTPGKIALLGFFLGMLTGRHVRRQDVRSRRFRDLTIHGPLPWGLQMDGDVLPIPLPCPIKVKRGALRVLVPAKSSTR